MLSDLTPGGDHPVQGFADNGIVGRLDHGRQAFAHFLRPLALGDIDADGYVLVKLSIRARQSNNRAVDPVEGPILGAVPNLAAPYSALSDGAVHLLEKFLGVVAGVYDAVILAEELFAGVLTDGAELVIDISDAPLHVGHSHNGVLIESEFLVGQILPRNLAGGGQTFPQCFLRFLESLYGRLALDNLDFHIAIHPNIQKIQQTREGFRPTFCSSETCPRSTPPALERRRPGCHPREGPRSEEHTSEL